MTRRAPHRPARAAVAGRGRCERQPGRSGTSWSASSSRRVPGAGPPGHPRYRRLAGSPAPVPGRPHRSGRPVVWPCPRRLEAQLEAAAAPGSGSGDLRLLHRAACISPPDHPAVTVSSPGGAAGGVAGGRWRSAAGRTAMGSQPRPDLESLRLSIPNRPTCPWPGGGGHPLRSVFSALLHNDRDLRFTWSSRPATSWTSTAAYPTTRSSSTPGLVALFLRRSGSRRRSGPPWPRRPPVHPVVALKVGRAQAAQAMVAAHSGALAGEDGAYQPCSTPTGSPSRHPASWPTPASSWPAAAPIAARWPPSATRAANGPTCSTCRAAPGPVRRHLRGDRQRLATSWSPGLAPTNPLDAWGTGKRADQIFATCIKALLEDPSTRCPGPQPRPDHRAEPQTSYTGLRSPPPQPPSPWRPVQPHLAGRPHRGATAPRAGVPVLEGTATCLCRVEAPVRLPRLPRSSRRCR